MSENRTNVDQFQLRLPPGLRERIKEKADANGRSMNAEIIASVESAIDAPDLHASDLRRLLDVERSINAKTGTMLEAQFDLLADYKGILKTARSQTLQQAGIIKSLCSITLMLEPDPEVIDLVQRLAEVTENMLSRSEDSDSMREVRRDVDSVIARADALLKKREK